MSGLPMTSQFEGDLGRAETLFINGRGRAA